MSRVPAVITEQSVTFYIGTDAFTVASSAPNYALIRDHLKQADHDEALLRTLSTPAEAVAQAVQAKVNVGYLPAGRIVVTPQGIWYNGQPLHSVLVLKILDLMSEGFDISPWVEFLANLFQNPVESAREELYEFLEKATLPITGDGHFIAYKIVGDDYKDLYSHTFDNSVGQVVEMPRSDVDPNRSNLCSRGLHFCSKGYLPHYGTGGGSRVMLVKINPADVVSIPTDYDFAKGRTWKYEVVGEVEREEAVEKAWPSYTGDYDPLDGDEYDEEYAEDEETADDVTVVVSPVAGVLTADGLTALKVAHGSWNAIARHFGVSTGTVSSWVTKLGLR